MRLIHIIVIILILSIPSTSISFTFRSNQQTNLPATSFDYNFEGTPIGNFPANSSWIGFNTVNLSSPSYMRVQNVKGVNGLQVSTFGYSGNGDQMLNLSIQPPATFNMKVTFSWNYNNSVISTGNIFEFGNGSSSCINYHFGPEYNKQTYLTGNGTEDLGPDPSVTSFYTLDVSWSGNQDLIYSDIENGWNTSMGLPYAINPAIPFYGPDFNLLIGGAYSNVTIYNIYVSKGNGDFNAPNYGPGIDFNQETVVSDLSGSYANSSTWLPIVDQGINSLLYVGNATEPGIYSYNYYNNTTRPVLTLPSGSCEVTAATGLGYAFFLTSGSITDLTSLNLSSLNAATLTLNASFGNGTHIIPYKNSIYLISENGTLEKINETGGELMSSDLIVQDIGKLTSSGYLSGMLTFSFSNLNSTSITEYEISANGSFVPVLQYTVTPFDAKYSATAGSNSAPDTLCKINITGRQTETALLENNLSAPLILDQNYSLVKTSSEYALLSCENGIYLASGTEIMATNIATNSSFVYVSNNMSFALGIKQDKVFLYYTGSNPFNGNGISVVFNPPELVSGIVSIPYSVVSSSNYTVQAKVGNMTLSPGFGYLNFSSYRLQNGTYKLYLNASNLAGYSTTYSSVLSVDNFAPRISTDPVNGSEILENSTITITISGLEGSISSTVHFEGTPASNFTGDMFQIKSPNEVGNTSLFLLVTDEFGVTRSYVYSFAEETPNTSGYKCDIVPNSFFSTGDINITWTPVKFVVLYAVTLASDSFHDRENITQNYSDVKLTSGEYILEINAVLQNTSVIQVANENFTVQLYNPSLNLSYSSYHYFSFFGNSKNNTLKVNASSNVSVVYYLNLTRNLVNVFSASGTGNSFQFDLNSTFDFLRANGEYTANLTAKEASGRMTCKSFNFYVNNSIPPPPVSRNLVYTNASTISLHLNETTNETFAYYFQNGTFGGTLTSTNSTINLEALYTRLVITGSTKFGNSNSTNFTVVESSVKPIINASVETSNLVWNNILHIEYTVADPVNLSELRVALNGTPFYTSILKSNEINITLTSDGNYSISLSVIDLCGNSNATNISGIVNYYYPTLESLSASIGMFMGISHLNARLTGKNLESVNTTWIVDGSVRSHSSSLYLIFLPGDHNITLVASFHSTQIESVRHVYTLGFMPEAFALIAVGIIFAYRRFGGKNDPELAVDVVLSNIGKSRPDVLKIARERKIRVRTVEYVIVDLSSSGKIRLLPDPDGIMYIMEPKGRN